MTAPLISVLTPAYNREKYIGEAIESVLSQSIDDFEIIVIDDGSTDKTIEVVNSYGDPRIVLLRNEHNKGISATRNHGLEKVRGKYVAMLDSDDVCLPHRFERQIDFLEQHSEIGVLGGWAKHIGTSNRQFTPEETDGELRARSLYRCPMVHSSTMIRTSVIEAGHIRYNESYPASNDYDFWVKALPYAKFHNLQEYIVQYRKHDQNISVTHRKDQKKYRVASSHLAFKNILGLNMPSKEHEKLFNVLTIAHLEKEDLASVESALDTLFEAAAKNSDLNQLYLKQAILKKFMDAYQNAGIETKTRLSFVKKHQAWKYLPFDKYYSVFAKLILNLSLGR